MVLTLKNDCQNDPTSIRSAVKRQSFFMTFLSALHLMSDFSFRWAMSAVFQCRNAASGTPKEGRTCPKPDQTNSTQFLLKY
jgi:hypothetical protein